MTERIINVKIPKKIESIKNRYEIFSKNNEKRTFLAEVKKVEELCNISNLEKRLFSHDQEEKFRK